MTQCNSIHSPFQFSSRSGLITTCHPAPPSPGQLVTSGTVTGYFPWIGCYSIRGVPGGPMFIDGPPTWRDQRNWDYFQISFHLTTNLLFFKQEIKANLHFVLPQPPHLAMSNFGTVTGPPLKGWDPSPSQIKIVPGSHNDLQYISLV